MADSMQNEALQRYRQMYSKAQSEHHSSENHSDNSQQSPVMETPKPEQSPAQEREKKGDNLLEIFMRDKEKSLILLLIVLLLSEKADSTLILSLLYLIL